MSKSSAGRDALPFEAAKELRALGSRLRAHRLVRGWTVAQQAERLLCSPTTLRALEAGKPGTSVGVLIHALWLLGQVDTLAFVAPAPAALVAGKRMRQRARKPLAGTISERDLDF